MNKQYKSKKGDISLLVTLLVCSIILILLAPLAQKVSVESKISRENLMSQQAVQAAKTGLDAWVYNFVNSTGSPSDILVTPLDSTLGIQYQVEFIPKSSSTPARIKSTGLVDRDGFKIERVLENTFNTIESITCPANYIPVPGNSMYGTSDFCVMKYEAKTGSATLAATTQAADLPRVNISQTNAITACSLAGGSLINNREWMTIARNIEGVASNWTGGSVGSGGLWRGHSDGSPFNALAANTDDNQGYEGTDNTSPSIERRTHTLSNGEVIWDMGGNVWEWTSDTILGNQKPNNSSGNAWQQWTAISNFVTLSYDLTRPSNPAWNSTQNMGQYYAGTVTGTTDFAFHRGGAWGGGTIEGVFALSLKHSPSTTDILFGFRCVFRLP